jgi:hypothetical protein
MKFLPQFGWETQDNTIGDFFLELGDTFGFTQGNTFGR